MTRKPTRLPRRASVAVATTGNGNGAMPGLPPGIDPNDPFFQFFAPFPWPEWRSGWPGHAAA